MQSLSYPLIAKAEVGSSFDPSRNGVISAKIEGFGEGYQDVYCTSPWMTRGEGGFAGMIPERGSSILVIRPIGVAAWYFIGCLFDNEPLLTEGGPNKTLEKLGNANRNLKDDIGGAVQAGVGHPGVGWHMQHNSGQGFGVKEQRSKKGIRNEAAMYTGTGKKVACIDSPAIDGIITDTGSKNGTARTTMTAEDPKSDKLCANMYQTETTGPTRFFNHESQTDIVVVDGREMQILNNSTGANAPAGDPDKFHWGNVNIQSKQNDINIFSKQPRMDAREEGKDGRIFIECLNPTGKEQIIQLRTLGEAGTGNNNDAEKCVIRLHSSGKVEIKTGPGFNVDIDCGGTINMKAQQDINLTANGQINLKSMEDDINIDGASEDGAAVGKIWLNSQHSSPALPEIEVEEGYYKDKGITTY